MNAPITTDLSDPALADLVEAVTAKLNAGEPLDLDAVAGEHPEQAETLRALLPALRMMQQAATANEGEAALPPLGTLGDFRLLREVGRGGMGVVYEAEQISLNRRVALKVLPFAATLDSRHLQRFKTEALASATLDHPNIVSVYGVGVERGVHYYAMRFVDGRTLADVIAEWRGAAAARPDATSKYVPGSAPTSPVAALSTKLDEPIRSRFRTVAEIGAQVAEALDHAHQCGIIHRDIKPANLLLDAAGKVWVTDFGLAQVQTDTRLTITGDLLGTLRYMSPEQALAKRVPVDPRTDVYSLGVTLYELLTHEAAFDGPDRQELLRQLAFEEPIPLRKRDRSVPAELEVIVTKAMAKNPAERYATAGELADDLRAFLADRPIKARPPGLGQRVAKWSRRNKTAVRAAATVCGLAVVALAVTTGLIAEAKGRTDRALDAEKAAVGDRDRALDVAQRRQAETDASLQNEIEAKRALQQSIEREQHLRYVATLATVDRLLRDGNLLRARQLLHELPPALRDWEWHYLNRLGHGEVATLGTSSSSGDPMLSPNGRRVLTRNATHITLWDTIAGKELICLTHPLGTKPATWAFSPDSAHFFLAFGKAVRIHDAQTGEFRFELEGSADTVADLAITPDNRRLIVATNDHVITVWDLKTRAAVTHYREHPGTISALRSSADGRSVVSHHREGRGRMRGARWWEVETGRTIRATDALDDDYQFTPDGDSVVATTKAAVELLPLDGGKPLLRLAAATHPAVTPGGRHVFVRPADAPNSLDLHDARTGTKITRFTGSGTNPSVVASPNGRQAILRGLGPSQGVPVVDVETGRVLYRMPPSETGDMRFSPDGTLLAMTLPTAEVRILDADTGEERGLCRGHLAKLRDLRFLPDGRHLFTADWAGVVKVWDATRIGDGNFTRLPRLQPEPGWREPTRVIPCSLAISADGRRIAMAIIQSRGKSDDPNNRRAVVYVHDRVDGSIRTFTVPPHSSSEPFSGSPVVALSNDGRRLACAVPGVQRGREVVSFRVLIEWDLTTAEHKPLWVKTEGSGWIASLRYAGDELRVASVLVEREQKAETIRVWRARDGVTLREIAAPVPLRPSSLWVALTHGGERLGVSRYGPFQDSPPSADPNEAIVWNVTGEDRPLRFPYAPPGPYGVGLTPDGRRAMVIGRQGGDLYDTASRNRVASFLFPKVPGNAPVNSDVKVADLSPNGRRVLYANGQQAVLLDALSGNELVVLNQSVVPSQSAWSADGRVLAVLGRDGNVYVWDGTPLAENPPPDPRVLFDLAWERATHADPKQRDGAAAVRLAKQAVERVPGYANGWLALGAAEYRTGNYASAIEALKKSLDRKPASPPRVKFFLAMANARLGLTSEARRWFDEAVKDAEAEKGSARVDELQRLRTEAESLLAARQ